MAKDFSDFSGKWGSEPTVWDGDLLKLSSSTLSGLKFQAHCVGWRHSEIKEVAYESVWLLCSKPTAWDGDTSTPSLIPVEPLGEF